METTDNGTLILPGSNNASSGNRLIDVYDREYDGRTGEGTAEEVDYEHFYLAHTGQLTGTGYQKDGFVVEDNEDLTQESDTIENHMEAQPRSRISYLNEGMNSEDDSDYEDPESQTDDDSDYEDPESQTDDDSDYEDPESQTDDE